MFHAGVLAAQASLAHCRNRSSLELPRGAESTTTASGLAASLRRAQVSPQGQVWWHMEAQRTHCSQPLSRTPLPHPALTGGRGQQGAGREAGAERGKAMNEWRDRWDPFFLLSGPATHGTVLRDSW